jgi:folate-binding protein YgfZ
MTSPCHVELPERGVLAVAGEDARDFLQGLISNDVLRVGPGMAIHAALLTAQGRYLHDFFVAEIGGVLHLDCEAGRRDDLMKRLRLYKLRAKVTLEDLTARFAVFALPGASASAAFGLAAEAGAAKAIDGGTAFVDPRHAAMGARAILPRDAAAGSLAKLGFAPGDRAGFEKLRLSLGLPDGSRDLVVEKSILLENGFDELNGVDWKKGCYVGQELTARTKYRGLIRKRLLPVRIEGPTPEPGAAIAFVNKEAGADQEAGEMRSAADGMGLALLRLEFLDRLAAEGGALTAGAARLTPTKPAWVKT